MEALLAANPDMYQSELRDRLMQDRGVLWVSLSTICRALRRKGITHKKVSASLWEHRTRACTEWSVVN